jgi:hypothetical protein
VKSARAIEADLQNRQGCVVNIETMKIFNRQIHQLHHHAHYPIKRAS